jgi:hypothetical protein
MEGRLGEGEGVVFGVGEGRTRTPDHSAYFKVRVILTYEIVIVLIAAEILVAAVNIVVDLYAGVD